MRSRILVTGGAGFIGSHLVDQLVARGDAVTVLDDFSTGREAFLSDAQRSGDLRIVRGSVTDPEAVSHAIEGCSRVYHLAVECVRRSLEFPLDNHAVNATGTLNLLEAARRNKISRFVYCSSSEVYGNASDGILAEDKVVCEPTTVYGAAKLAGEYYAKAYFRTYQLPTTVVRPFNAYGPREHHSGVRAEVIPRFLIRILNGLPPVIFGDGSACRDFTYVEEVARGILLCGDTPAAIGRTINIARGTAISVTDVATTLLRVCQRLDLTPDHLPPRPGDVRHLHADTEYAREILGFHPEIAFEEGLERYLAWFSSHYPDPSALLEPESVNWRLPE